VIRRADGSKEEADWIRRTAALVYAELGDYGKIIPSWMSHAGVMTYLETIPAPVPAPGRLAGEGEIRRGFILLGFYEPSDAPGRLAADLLAIAVAPEHQRKGVGRSLLEFALEIATVAGEQAPVSEMRLTVAATNPAGLALFRAHGFEVLDERHGAYDGGQRAIRMRRRLP
jgi:ribosomal protein S18 acetylase RimI-like enzyme